MKFSEGTKLAQDHLNGCVVVRDYVQHMWLSPRYLNGRIQSGVKELLEKQIGKYNESLDGLHLAYSNVKVIQRASFLLYDSVDMHFDVQYDAVIFRACPGTLLKCTINKVSTDHLGCLIHKVINMSVPVPAWTLDPNQVIGQEVICKVTKVEYKKGVLGIIGQLADDSLTSFQEKFATSEETRDDEKGMDNSQNNNTIDLSNGRKKKGKRRKKKVSEDMEQEEESFSNTSQTQNDSLFTSSLSVEETSDSHNSDRQTSDRDCRDIKEKKKKKRKRKNTDEMENNNEAETLLEEDLLVKDEKRKKKKKRKIEKEDVSEDFEDLNDSGINGYLSDEHLDSEETLHYESLNEMKKKHKKKCKKKKISDD